jgi:hypothetical protein
MTAQDKVPGFSESYDRARRAYGFVAALLFTWEFVGFDLGEVGGEGVKLTIKSPAALPYVLAVLVVYFSFRLSIEWLHTVAERRRTVPARIDFCVAHVIGAGAVLVLIGQVAFQRQLFDLIRIDDSARKTLLSAVVGAALSAVWTSRGNRPGVATLALGIGIALAIAAAMFYSDPIKHDLSVMIVSAVAAAMTLAIGMRAIRRSVEADKRRAAELELILRESQQAMRDAVDAANRHNRG